MKSGHIDNQDVLGLYMNQVQLGIFVKPFWRQTDYNPGAEIKPNLAEVQGQNGHSPLKHIFKKRKKKIVAVKDFSLRTSL